jgi:hypothetical protein
MSVNGSERNESKKISQSETRIAYGGHVINGSGRNKQSL